MTRIDRSPDGGENTGVTAYRSVPVAAAAPDGRTVAGTEGAGLDRVDRAVPARLHYMDTMRAMLMLLGVVLHSARPYDSSSWRVKNPDLAPAFDVLVGVVHLFRMPAFFVIAGFFAMFLVQRRPTGVFLRERMQRVLVPLMVMLVSVNLLQLWFLSGYRGGIEGFIDSVLLPAVLDGNLASHLWFLAALCVYFALAALSAPWLRNLTMPSPGPATDAWRVALVVAISAAVLAPLAVAVLGKLTAVWSSWSWFDAYLLGLVRVSVILEYLPFFAVGVLLGVDMRLLDRFARVDAWVLVLGATAAMAVYLAAGHEQTAWRALFIVAQSLLAWMAVRVVFAAFRRYADRPSRVFAYLSDASYSVYLFHHIVVIVTATWLLGWQADPWLKFTVVLTTASVVPLLVYHLLIRRYPTLRYLFNGAIRPPVPQSGPVSASGQAALRILPARERS